MAKQQIIGAAAVVLLGAVPVAANAANAEQESWFLQQVTLTDGSQESPSTKDQGPAGRKGAAIASQESKADDARASRNAEQDRWLVRQLSRSDGLD